MSFGQAFTRRVGHQWDVTEFRRGQLERPIEKQLTEGGREEIRPAHNFSDLHRRIVDHDGELISRDIIFSPDDEIAKLAPGSAPLRTGALVDKIERLALRHPKPPGDSCGIVRSGNGHAVWPAAATINRLLVFRMRRRGGTEHVPPRTGAGVNETAIPEFSPGRQVERTPPTLQDRGFLPTQTKPAQIVIDRLPKLQPRAGSIQVFNPEKHRSAALATALLCPPESDGMAGVEITRRRRREPAAIRSDRLQIADFRLPEALFNLKSPLLNTPTTAPAAKRLLLFDIDGTLINSAGAGVAALRDVLRDEFGITDNLEGIEIAGRTDKGIVHQILRKIGVDPNESNTARFLAQYVDLLARELPQRKGSVLPGICELLEKLRRQPEIVLALLTGNVEQGARLKLEHYGLWHFFEFGAFADDHHDRNELGAFARQRAQERHGVEFGSAAIDVIGDTPHDIACGKAIGARTIAVATGSFSPEELAKREPDIVLEDFAAVEIVMKMLGW